MLACRLALADTGGLHLGNGRGFAPGLGLGPGGVGALGFAPEPQGLPGGVVAAYASVIGKAPPAAGFSARVRARQRCAAVTSPAP